MAAEVFMFAGCVWWVVVSVMKTKFMSWNRMKALASVRLWIWWVIDRLRDPILAGTPCVLPRVGGTGRARRWCFLAESKGWQPHPGEECVLWTKERSHFVKGAYLFRIPSDEERNTFSDGGTEDFISPEYFSAYYFTGVFLLVFLVVTLFLKSCLQDVSSPRKVTSTEWRKWVYLGFLPIHSTCVETGITQARVHRTVFQGGPLGLVQHICFVY